MFEKDFNESATGYGRNYAPPGLDTDVKIVVIGERLPKDSFKGEHSFFVEYKVPSGVAYSWVQKIPEKDGVQKERTRALSTIKGFLSALVGPEEFEKSDHAEVYKMATSESNPFHDESVHLRTRNKKTKANTDFTVHDWTPTAPAPAATK